MSGRGAAGERRARAVAGRLEARGHTVERVATRLDAGGSGAAAMAARGGVDRVVAIGGDGTVTAVAEGLIAAGGETAMAIVPGGTANILALNLGVPTSLLEAIETAENGPAIRIDAGRVDGRVFLLTFGAGLHADIVARTGRAAKRRWGVAAYGLAYLEARRDSDVARYRIRCDGEMLDLEASMVQVMNCGSVFRREWALAPEISPVDGRLDVVALKAASIPGQVAAAAHVLRGRPTDTELVVHRKAARVELEAYPAVPVQRDGERAGRTPARIEVLSAVLPVVVPEGSPWHG